MLYPLQNISNRLISDFEAVPNYSGVLDCLAKVYAKEGLIGFYRGFVWQMLLNLLNTTFKTIQYKCRLLNDDEDQTSLKNIPLEITSGIIRSGLQTLILRASIGLPLVAPGATGLGKVWDVFSGLQCSLVNIAIEQALNTGDQLIKMENQLPPFAG